MLLTHQPKILSSCYRLNTIISTSGRGMNIQLSVIIAQYLMKGFPGKDSRFKSLQKPIKNINNILMELTLKNKENKNNSDVSLQYGHHISQPLIILSLCEQEVKEKVCNLNNSVHR